ncbi:uncharacterized protein LOC116213660 [Punica granatum]|uniref:Uncharacterized protein LOC116213660 n=1 Tax=Punica granatum TaxID=22663 RepID=A0A6P8EDE0_PUNGR|nr:uncharacterized protein LOC116213660 [Punica granatum]
MGELYAGSQGAHDIGKIDLAQASATPKLEDVKAISEILDIARSRNNMKAIVHCAATINDILLENDWYYTSCTHCKRKVDKTARNFCCVVSGSTIFVLFNEVTEQLTDAKASHLSAPIERERAFGDVNKFDLPPELIKIFGFPRIFQIRMSSFLESRGSSLVSFMLEPGGEKFQVSSRKAVKIENPPFISSNEKTPKKSTKKATAINAPDLPYKRRKLRSYDDEDSEHSQEETSSGVGDD